MGGLESRNDRSEPFGIPGNDIFIILGARSETPKNFQSVSVVPDLADCLQIIKNSRHVMASWINLM